MIAGDVAIAFDGRVYQNSSIIDLSSIDSTNGYVNAITCVTDQQLCCNTEEANWYFPDNTTVTSQSNFIQNKGFSQQLVLYRNGATYFPNGIFHCRINDSSNSTHRIYIGIYLKGLG